MFIVSNYSTSILLCIITMLCWGSWANTQKLAGKSWRFELFYWDYVVGIVLCSLLFAFTLGSNGSEGRSFMPDLMQAGRSALISAFVGGVIFNAANILLVAAIAIAGMSVAFPVGIGIALVLGVLLNYASNPVGNPIPLFSGVGFICIAIMLNAYAYRKNGGAGKKVSSSGLVLSIVAGVLMGLFYKYVAASMFPDFAHPETGKLSPYTAVFIFSIGILLSNFLFNSILMRKPVEGERVQAIHYFQGSSRKHLMGILGGLIWCIGMSLNILASGKAGAAISYGLGQGATIIAALWGIYVWKEFRNAPAGTSRILNVMLLCYVAGLGLLIAAR